MAMAQAMLGLEPSHLFHVLQRTLFFHLTDPMDNGLTVFLFDRGEVGCGSLGFGRCRHGNEGWVDSNEKVLCMKPFEMS
jgi:hypothetical protein